MKQTSRGEGKSVGMNPAPLFPYFGFMRQVWKRGPRTRYTCTHNKQIE